MMNIVKGICSKEGLACVAVSSLTGGDINDAYILNTHHRRYFLKINTAAHYPAMFQKEAEGLKALQ